MNSSFCRHFGWVVAALAAAAFVAPAAQAYHAAAEHTTTTAQQTPAPGRSMWKASGREIDRLGPKYVPLQHPIAPPPATVIKAVRPVGFDWGDAGIGAAFASLALALVAAFALLVTRRKREESPRSELAGA